MTTIGFIGLGNMGLPMASNLVAAGFTVRGFDRDASALMAATAAGVTAAESTTDCIGNAELVFMMLPDGAIALGVLKEVLSVGRKDQLIVDCSTIDIADARAAHSMAEQHGALYLDAPVSGGVGGASTGTLTIMLGGEDHAIDMAEPALKPLAGRLIRCGRAGAGQAAKLCNNMLLATSMIGTAEAFSLGARLGLDATTLFDVLSTSTGSCWSVNTYCPVAGVGPESPADRDFRPGFPAQLMLKDMALTQSAADAVDQATPLGQRAYALYHAFVEAGGGEQDFSAIIEYLATQPRSPAHD